MRNCKKYIILFCMLFMLLFLQNKVWASTKHNPKEAMIPSISKLYEWKDNKYFTVYKDNYYLDIKETGMFRAWGPKVFNMMANGIFSLQVMIAQIIIILIYYAFEISFFELFEPIIEPIIRNLRQGIFDELFVVCISFIGIFYVVKMIRNQKTQVWMALMQTIVIMTLSISFFKQPVVMLKAVDNFAKDIGQIALDGTFKATNNRSSESAIEAVSSNLWEMLVHKPWQIMEFGNISFAEKNEDKILRLAPESEERQKIIEEIAKDKIHFQAGMGNDRFVLALVNFFIFMIIVFVIAILTALMMAYQVLAIGSSLLAPIVFLIALIPWFGFNTFGAWVAKIISFSSMKAIISLAIAIIFSFMLSMFNLTDQYGYLVVMMLQVIVIGTVWYKRESLLSRLFVLTRDARSLNPRNINRTLRSDANLEGGFRDWTRGYKGLKRGSSDNDDGNAEDVKYARYDKDYSRNVVLVQDDSAANNNSMSTVNANLNKLLKVSEDILEKRYENSKNESELRAEKLGKEPEYSNWVKVVMNRENMNLPKFEEREKVAVVNQIKNIIDKGGNIEDIYNKSETESYKEVGRPKEIIIKDSTISEETTEGGETNQTNSINIINTLTNEFNETYNKEYDPRFMERLVKKYGQDNVSKILREMKKINQSNGINNPAGYLTQSLKNNGMNNESSLRPGPGYKENSSTSFSENKELGIRSFKYEEEEK